MASICAFVLQIICCLRGSAVFWGKFNKASYVLPLNLRLEDITLRGIGEGAFEKND
jgi:hypothetical protein